DPCPLGTSSTRAVRTPVACAGCCLGGCPPLVRTDSGSVARAVREGGVPRAVSRRERSGLRPARAYAARWEATVVVRLGPGELLRPAARPRAQRGPPPPSCRHRLSDVQLEPLATGRLALSATGCPPLLDSLPGPEHHAVPPAAETPHGLDHLRR